VLQTLKRREIPTESQDLTQEDTLSLQMRNYLWDKITERYLQIPKAREKELLIQMTVNADTLMLLVVVLEITKESTQQWQRKRDTQMVINEQA